MPGATKKKSVPRRRRHDDGEEEGSTIEELGELSLSDGSASSDEDEEPDIEGSESSTELNTSVHNISALNIQSPETRIRSELIDHSLQDTSQTRADIDLNNGGSTASGEVPADDTQGSRQGPNPRQVKEQRGLMEETPAQRSRREHLAYIQERNSNPAFVPNRGGFFLHDDRGMNQAATSSRPFRGRGRGRGNGVSAHHEDINDPLSSGPAERQWAHDLHETLNVADTNTSKQPPVPPKARATTSIPNRSFSTTTVLGNVPVQVFLPGLESKKSVFTVVKKQHTLLPEHRPPLRRDKPVRISIPDQHPRYIFPSTERSFIFIPRALRPNQQGLTRGRGRGSFHGSRRPSIFGGSTYTPSIGMSRKSSIGGTAPGSGVQTPTGGPLPPSFTGLGPRPIVRMPLPNLISTASMPPYAISNNYAVAQYRMENGGMIHQSPPTSLPMHQPRPQKTVSVADIESPGVKAPLQQQEQPFHQQMPATFGYAPEQARQPGPPNNVPLAALAHIPEGAVYAQPFQPFPVGHPAAYYGMAYPPGPYFYPPNNEGPGINLAMGGPVMAPTPDSHYIGAGTSTPNSTAPQVTVAHESNGMVYYYDPSHLPGNPSMSQYTSGNPSIPGMMPPGPFFFPPLHNGAFYPQQSNR